MQRRPWRHSPDGLPVFLLVQEEAGLLAVFHIHIILHAVLTDFDLGIKGRGQETAGAGKPLLLADLGVAPLVDAADLDAVRGEHGAEGLENEAFQTVGAECERLDDQNILIFVDGDAWQEIRLAEDDAAGGGVNDFLPVLPGGTHPPGEEGIGNFLLFVPGEHPDADGRPAVDEAISEEIAVKIADRQDVAVLKRTLHPVDFVVIDPESACLEKAALLRADIGGGADAEIGFVAEIIIHADGHRVPPYILWPAVTDGAAWRSEPP